MKNSETQAGPAPSNAFMQVLRDAAGAVMDRVREKVNAPLLIGG